MALTMIICEIKKREKLMAFTESWNGYYLCSVCIALTVAVGLIS